MKGYIYKTSGRYARIPCIGLEGLMADLMARKVITKVINPEDRESALFKIVQHDTFHARLDWLDANMEIHDDRIYRVSIFPGEIYVLCLGLLPSDSSIEGQYSSADELPLWMQERLAVLMMMSLETPTVELVGVGRRISSNVYWVYKPETTS
jgi:hypothetical protein